MSIPVLLDVRDTPIQLDYDILNSAFENNTGISSTNMTQPSESTESIRSAVEESYLATASRAVLGTEEYDVTQVSIPLTEQHIVDSVASSITPQSIQSIGNDLITQHSRSQTSPFQPGDTFHFLFNFRPGDFTITNDAPNNIREGVSFFTTSISDRPTLFGPGITRDISNWVYTLDSLNGPYYYGTEQSGFQVHMAIQLSGTIEEPSEPVSYNYTYTVDWVNQPSSLNTIYTQEYTSVVIDSNLYSYTAFFSRSTSSSSSSNIVLVKMDPCGNIVWDTTQNSQFNSNVNSTSRDERPSVALSESTGQLLLSYITLWAPYSETVYGGFDIRVVSVDISTGNVLWTYRGPEINTSGNEDRVRVATTINDSSFLLANSVRGNTSESNGAYQGTSNTYDDVIFSKLDLSGNHIWTTHSTIVNTTNTDIQPSITSDSSGNVYVAYISAGNVNNLGNDGSYDVYVVKASSSGTVLGVFHPQGVNTNTVDVVPSIQYSSYDDTLYLAHYTQFPFNVIITKLDLDCNVIWTENSQTNYTVTNEHLGITVDQFTGMCVFGYGATSNRPNNYDLIIGGIDPSGTVRFLTNFPELQSSGSEILPSLHIGTQDSLVVAYQTTGAVSGTHSGSNDIVVAKLIKTPV